MWYSKHCLLSVWNYQKKCVLASPEERGQAGDTGSYLSFTCRKRFPPQDQTCHNLLHDFLVSYCYRMPACSWQEQQGCNTGALLDYSIRLSRAFRYWLKGHRSLVPSNWRSRGCGVGPHQPAVLGRSRKGRMCNSAGLMRQGKERVPYRLTILQGRKSGIVTVGGRGDRVRMERNPRQPVVSNAQCWKKS